MKSYGQVLDSIEALPDEEQESLMDIVRKRLAERRRAEHDPSKCARSIEIADLAHDRSSRMTMRIAWMRCRLPAAAL